MNTTSVRRIRVLSPLLVNQIAAGEVVERPASVVKELVENALDAGATLIEISLQRGGLHEILVRDDGCGINPEDLALAVHPHATSKIESSEDLEAIRTFGFRGEALASIASVSELEITSRTAASEYGNQLKVRQGAPVGESEAVAAPPGTAVRVRELFQLIPGRLKYMRSEATEYSHCAKVIREIALGNPQVRFHLRHQNRLTAQYTSTTLADRFKEVMRVKWEPLPLEASTSDGRLYGLISPPHAEEERGEFYLFVNRRPVRQRLLHGAVRRAYQDAVGFHHDPSGVLCLDIRPDWVDANVHPQKWEIRLLGQERWFAWIVATLRKALSAAAPSDLSSSVLAEPSKSFSPLTGIAETQASPLACKPSYWGYVGRTRDGLWVLENQTGLHLAHPLAVCASVWFRRWHHALLQTGRLPSEPLSIPEILTLNANELSELSPRLGELERLGFEAQLFGDRDVAISRLPTGFPSAAVAEFIRQHFLSRADANASDLVSQLALTAVDKSGQSGTEPDPQALLTELENQPLLSAKDTWPVVRLDWGPL